MNFISTEFEELLQAQKPKTSLPRMSKISKKEGEEILDEIVFKYSLGSRKEALAALCLLAQQGGTSKGCDGNLTISIFSKEFKLSDIRKIFQTSSKQTLRKFARTFANEAHAICLVFDVPGNLHKKIIRMHPDRDFSTSELVWLSDFQSENQNCPTEFRQFIIEAFNFRQSFTNKSKRTGK